MTHQTNDNLSGESTDEMKLSESVVQSPMTNTIKSLSWQTNLESNTNATVKTNQSKFAQDRLYSPRTTLPLGEDQSQSSVSD